MGDACRDAYWAAANALEGLVESSEVRLDTTLRPQLQVTVDGPAQAYIADGVVADLERTTVERAQ